MEDSLALNVINFLGNKAPSEKQIKLVETLLSHSGLVMQLDFDLRLTKREIDVLQLARLGFNATVTAGLLQISRKTVEQHRNEAKKKLGAKSIAEAVALGIKYGFLCQPITSIPLVESN